MVEGEELMTKEKLYDMVLDDFIHGDIYEPQSMIKDLIMLLDSEAVEKFKLRVRNARQDHTHRNFRANG
jgi:hypothetical protein